MMKNFTGLLFLLLFTCGSLWAQKEGCGEIQPAYSLKANSIWALSDSLGLDFNTSGDPQAFNTKIHSGPIYNCATVSDSSGTLLFYTNGSTVWAADGSVMPHGQYITGGTRVYHGGGFYGQTCQVVQVPYQPGKYYVFTIGTIMSVPMGYDLYCNLIDLSLNNGLGDVVDSFYLKGVPLHNPADIMHELTTRLTAIADCNHNVWILTLERYYSIFRAFKVSPSGIDTVPVVSDLTNELPFNLQQGGASYGESGFLSPSPNGRKLVLTSHSSQYNITDYDFDPATGLVSHPQVLFRHNEHALGAGNFAGAVFSPDNSKIYGTSGDSYGNWVILQYDLNSSVPDSLIPPMVIDTLMDNSIVSPNMSNGLQLAHDGKIYFGRGFYLYQISPGMNIFGFRKLGRINFPNNAGQACGFEDSVASIDFSSLPIEGNFLGTFPDPVAIPQSSLHISIHFQNDTLFAQPNTFDSYQWYHNGSPVAGGNNPFLPVSDTSGQYAVAVKDTSCGCSDSVLYNITNHLGIGSTFANSNQIRIYPNPTHDKIFVEAPIALKLSLYDLTGRLLLQSEGKNQMNIAAFADGVYLLRVEDRQGRFVKMEKVVKRKIK